jgi:hypothetical protein
VTSSSTIFRSLRRAGLIRIWHRRTHHPPAPDSREDEDARYPPHALDEGDAEEKAMAAALDALLVPEPPRDADLAVLDAEIARLGDGPLRRGPARQKTRLRGN